MRVATFEESVEDRPFFVVVNPYAMGLVDCSVELGPLNFLVPGVESWLQHEKRRIFRICDAVFFSEDTSSEQSSMPEHDSSLTHVSSPERVLFPDLIAEAVVKSTSS